MAKPQGGFIQGLLYIIGCIWILEKTSQAGLNFSWLGICYLFQTFENLDRVKDKQAEIKIIRNLIDEDSEASPAGRSKKASGLTRGSLHDISF